MVFLSTLHLSAIENPRTRCFEMNRATFTPKPFGELCFTRTLCMYVFGGRLLVIYSAFSLCAGFSKISRGPKTTQFAPSNSIFSEIDWRLTKLAPSNRILLCKLIRVNTSELQNKAAIKIAWQVVRFLSFVFCWSLFRLSPWSQKPDQENLDTRM